MTIPQDQKAAALRECPFCGDGTQYKPFLNETIEKWTPTGKAPVARSVYQVCCESCGAETMSDKSPEVAVRSWNDRATSEPMERKAVLDAFNKIRNRYTTKVDDSPASWEEVYKWFKTVEAALLSPDTVTIKRGDVSKIRYSIREARRMCWTKEMMKALLDDALEILEAAIGKGE